MTPFRSLLVLMSLASVVEAAPTTQTFRQLDWSGARAAQRLATYTLTRDGDAITLDIETMSMPRGGAWKADGKDTLTGKAVVARGGLELHLTKDKATAIYRCKQMTVPVAGAKAVRAVWWQGESSGPYGRWAPATTTNVAALVCTLDPSTGEVGLRDGQLVFAARAIEHVSSDMNCCKKPGDSLRFVPADRSVTPAYKE